MGTHAKTRISSDDNFLEFHILSPWDILPITNAEIHLMPEPVVHISISDEKNNNIVSNIKVCNKKQLKNLFHNISKKIQNNISDFNIKKNLNDNLKYEIQFVKSLKDK